MKIVDNYISWIFSRLMKNEGIVIDPEIDEVLAADYDPNNPGNREYFSRAANEENINRLLANADIGIQTYSCHIISIRSFKVWCLN